MHINYLPNIGYFQQVLLNDTDLVLHKSDKYNRHTYRNRCEIAGPNAKLTLSIPTQQLKDTRFFSDVKISYQETWQKQHWRSIESAYRRSAYFEYYESYFSPFYVNKDWEYLWEYNLDLIKLLNKLLKLQKNIVIEEAEILDAQNKYPLYQNVTYNQVFSDRQPFFENLSIIDLLFNKGPMTLGMLNVK